MALAHVKEVRTKADKMATASFTQQRFHLWPFPLLSIGHNMQSFQNYSFSPYWHDGLDIRSVPNQIIYAAAGGKIVNIENYVKGDDHYWEIAIQDNEGFVWKYHHVDKNSIPSEIKDAYKSGHKISDGAIIGNVVKWEISSYGEVYHHLHLLVVGKDGQYINPFLMMQPLSDTVSPVINKIGLAKNHRPIEGQAVKGQHALYMEASDLTLHHKFLLPPHKISYRLDKGEEQLVWEFIHLPSGKNDTDYIDDFYMEGTCGNYSCRKFLFNLNFTVKDPRALMKLTPGPHEVEVSIEDVVGNKTSKNFSWTVL